MNKNERSATIGAVTMLCEAFGKTATEATFKAYEIGLEGLSVEEINLAASRALATCRFMPPPVELREMLAGNVQDRAAKAWVAFERAVRRYGYTRSVCFDDPCVNATVRGLGGWVAVCDLPAKEFDAFLPKRFQELYGSLSRAGFAEDQGEPLMGWFDQQNGSNGYGAGELVLVATGIPPQARQKLGIGMAARKAAGITVLELRKP